MLFLIVVHVLHREAGFFGVMGFKDRSSRGLAAISTTTKIGRGKVAEEGIHTSLLIIFDQETIVLKKSERSLLTNVLLGM